MSDLGASDLVTTYYVSVDAGAQNEFTRGQIHICPCLYLRPKLSVLEARVDLKGHAPPIWCMRTIDRAKFNDPTHVPLPKPRLEADEEYVAFVAKCRPVVLLSSQTEPWMHRSRQARDECFLVAPIFSFHDDDEEDWKRGIRALKYRELFYLPADDHYKMAEGFIRFDRLQCVPRAWLRQRGLCLHDDALAVLESALFFYITGRDDGLYIAYRTARLEAEGF